eukprot:8614579-Lingulodinium_polyedra.AAC.1
MPFCPPLSAGDARGGRSPKVLPYLLKPAPQPGAATPGASCSSSTCRAPGSGPPRGPPNSLEPGADPPPQGLQAALAADRGGR